MRDVRCSQVALALVASLVFALLLYFAIGFSVRLRGLHCFSMHTEQVSRD